MSYAVFNTNNENNVIAPPFFFSQRGHGGLVYSSFKTPPWYRELKPGGLI